MTVSQVELQREQDGEINIREIKALFQDVSQLLDVNFFINQSELSKDHDIEKIAQVIKARNYEKVKKQISVFDARIKHTLDNMKVNQDKLMTEYNAHIRNIQVSDVQTNTVLMNLRSQGAYDEADDFFKKQLEARKNIMDRAENIKNKYDDEVSKFNDKKIELQEQLDKIMENVKPAFDQDIVALIGNLNQIVISNIRNEEVFKAFILGNLTKVIYTFLYNMIDSIAAQRDITRIIDGMNVEISKIVDGNTESLKRGFINKAEYLNKGYTINKSLFNELESSINSLPYKQCEDRRPTIENILRISKEKKFVFTDIIDPEKLNNIKKEIELFKSDLQESLNESQIILNDNLPVFSNVNDMLTSLNANYDQIVRNKEHFLAPVSKELYFIFGLLNEENDSYIKDYKKLINDISVDFNNIYKVQISKILTEIQKTDMLTIPAKEYLDNNMVIDFLKYKEKLIIKKEELIPKISDLDRLLTEIDDVPKTSSLKYKKKISNLFWIALIPIANIVVLLSMNSIINKLKPAIQSDSSVYNELFREIITKFKVNMYIHIGLAVVLGIITLPTIVFLWVPVLYVISVIMIYSQKSKLRSFKMN